MEALARAWLDGLSRDQAVLALHPFEARRDWHFVPRARPGLALRGMDPSQAAACWRLVDSVLSAAGSAKARNVLALEPILGAIERRPSHRDPGNYALAIFGEPSPAAPWAWRFEGHHLSLTVTAVPGEGTAVTPAFFGANPAVVPPGHAQAGTEAHEVERQLAFELIQSLAGAAFERCRIAVDAPRDILTMPGAERRLVRPDGLPFAALADGQKALAWRLVQAFLRHLEEARQAASLAQITEAGLERLHFAWAGSTTLGRPHYFRLHGPSTVIEYDNVQNGANHVHTVWHEPDDVFGDDRLARHHSHDH
jgi:hypothetical protein